MEENMVLILLALLLNVQLTKGIQIDDIGNGIDQQGCYINYENSGCEMYDEILTIVLYNPVSGENFFRYDTRIPHEDVFIDVYRNGEFVTYEDGKSYYIENP